MQAELSQAEAERKGLGDAKEAALQRVAELESLNAALGQQESALQVRGAAAKSCG